MSYYYPGNIQEGEKGEVKKALAKISEDFIENTTNANQDELKAIFFDFEQLVTDENWSVFKHNTLSYLYKKWIAGKLSEKDIKHIINKMIKEMDNL